MSPSLNGPKEYITHYLSLGLTPIRMKFRGKEAAGPWDKNIITSTNLDDLLQDGPWNVGILLGKSSNNLIVFDYESKEALAEHYELLKEYNLKDLLDTWVVQTGKGAHVYFFIDWKDPNAYDLLKPIRPKTIFTNLEVRGDKDLVVAPPSVHPSGVKYQFVQGPYMPIKTIGSKEYAILLYTYAKATGDVSAPKFEELHEKLTKLYPSYHEIDILPPKVEESPDLPVSKYLAEIPVTEDANPPLIANIVKPYLEYVARQEFTLTLASTLARLGVHPLKGAEVLAALLDDPEFTKRRSERDANEALEAKKRVQAWIYTYNNAWQTLRGKSLEKAFPNIKRTFLQVLKEKSEKFGPQVAESWWYTSTTSGDRIRGIPSLLETIAMAIEEQRKVKGEVISGDAARELAWRVVQNILKAAKPSRRKVEHFKGLTRVYVVGTPKVQESYLVPGKQPTQTYLSNKQKLEDSNPELAKELESKTVAFKVVSFPIVYQDRSGIIYKGQKKVYYYRILESIDEEKTGENEGNWVSFAVEFIKGVPLTPKPIEILKAVFYQGTTFLKLYLEGTIIEGNIETVLDKLIAGGVASYDKEILRKYFTWISQSYRGTAYLAPGIYEENGRFVPVLPTTTEHLLPNSPITATFVDRLKLWSQKVSLEDYENFLKGVVEYRNYLPKSVYFASMSYMGIAGFLSALLDVTGSIKPALFFVGPKGTGKSHIAKFIAVSAYGSEVWGPSAYRTDFRFDELFSSRTFVLFFDDITKHGSEKLRDLKSILTENTQTFRGRGIGNVKLYELAAVPIFTGNEMVPEFENDDALMDRLIILQLNELLPHDKRREFREKLDDMVGISKGVVYVHHFVKDLVDLANEVGGKPFLKARFKHWFKFAVREGITDGRDPEKFAILMLGAELLSALLAKHNLEFNLNEAAEAILEIFKGKETIIPQELHDLISIAKAKNIGTSLQEGLLITNNDLTEIRAAAKGSNFEIPSKLRKVAQHLEGFGYPRSQTLPKSGHYVSNLKSKVYGVLIPWEIVRLVEGEEVIIEEEEEVTSEDLEKLVLWIDGNTFEELQERTGWPEKKLTKALIKLDRMGVIVPRDGKYFVDTKKAYEKGFPVIAPADPDVRGD